MMTEGDTDGGSSFFTLVFQAGAHNDMVSLYNILHFTIAINDMLAHACVDISRIFDFCHNSETSYQYFCVSSLGACGYMNCPFRPCPPSVCDRQSSLEKVSNGDRHVLMKLDAKWLLEPTIIDDEIRRSLDEMGCLECAES